MPSRVNVPCRHPGCPALIPYGQKYCEEHKKLTGSKYNRYTREKSVKKEYGASWKKARERHAARYPYCEQCYREGLITMMEEVHHIIPVARGGTHADSNLMSWCKSCHNNIHHDLGDR